MLKRNKLIRYVQANLAKELIAVNSGPIATVKSDLIAEERALIYKYCEDGYEHVNYSLRNSKGEVKTEFGQFLDETLKKLPDYKGLVFRSADLSETEIQRYEEASGKNLH